MYRKIVWCYVLVLTLLDISLNTKLSAQGKSHDATVHDSLIEGITFQEWGRDGSGAGGRGAGPAAEGSLSLAPAALHFGRAALAAAHALTVTLTNTANTTMHLASVAGTTPDFHASFFEAKSLPPQANTTFSVVYLGRREGPVSAHLYIHTSLGVHKYPVSAVGVASEYRVWPLVNVRVPANASVEPLLTLYNPTDQTIQVTEVYSSGAWLGLALADGGAAAARAAWSVPPRAARPLVRLRIRARAAHPLTAYVRIKANIPGGGLVVCVEARAAPPGEFVSPLQLRLRTRGASDPPDVIELMAGNSASTRVQLDASVWGARCAATPPSPPPPPAPPAAHPAHPALHNGQDKGTANGNAGARASGVLVSLERAQLEPQLGLTRVARLTIDYGKLWAQWAGGAGAGAGAEGAWCAGWVRLGRAALPYSVRVLPGALQLLPAQLHFVTAHGDSALRDQEVRVRNDFPEPVQILGLDYSPELDKYFEVVSLGAGALAPGASASVARVRLRASATGRSARDVIHVRSNVTDHALPVLVYSGRIEVEWDWPDWDGGALRLGTLGASSTRRVAARLRHGAPAALCVRDVRLQLAGASLALGAGARCVAPGAALGARLTVVAPARELALGGLLSVRAQAEGGPAPVETQVQLSLRALPGRLAAPPLPPLSVAPYAGALTALWLHSTMAAPAQLLRVAVPADDPALDFQAASSVVEVTQGRHIVGTVTYSPEELCRPNCYTGLDLDSPEGVSWVRRGEAADSAALRADAALQQQRHALFRRAAESARNISLLVHTSLVLAVPVEGSVLAAWPRLLGARPEAPLGGVGAAAPLRLRVRNPASVPVVLQPVLLAEQHAVAGTWEAPLCRAEACTWSEDAFALSSWRSARGAVRTWAPEGSAPHNSSRRGAPLLLAPGAELELKLQFTPHEPSARAAVLYLRNNLTILEAVQLAGRGSFPSFELGGRRPGSIDEPIVFEATECSAVRLSLSVRNTGAAPLRLRGWRVAGGACGARGWRVEPCGTLALAPNASRVLALSWAPDWTLAHAGAALTLRADSSRAFFPLRAAAAPALLARCARRAPRPPWDPALRAAAAPLAVALLVLVVAAGALDAERSLRRARAGSAARSHPPARAPLDLRALAAHAPAAPPARAPARRKRARVVRSPAARDTRSARSERRAFERWRADVLRAPAPPTDAPPAETHAPDPAPPAPPADGYEADPETEERVTDHLDDTESTASSSSPTVDEHDDHDDDHDEPDDDQDDDLDEREDNDERDDRDDRDRRDDDDLDALDEKHPPQPPGDRPAETPPDEARPAGDYNAAAKPTRARRDAADTPRRTRADADGGARTRPGASRHSRKERGARRRASPGRSPARTPEARAGAGAGGLRWGASWSSVVRASALAPIGSDVRRRPPTPPSPPAAPAQDNSLFYYNGDAPPRDDFWHAANDRPAFTPARDYLVADEPPAVGAVGAVGAGGYRSLNSVWGSALEPRASSPWLWGGFEPPSGGAAAPVGAVGAPVGAVGAPVGAPVGASVRPPPGFGPARGVRTYDPFRSLASIWAPGALDWRPPAPSPQPPTPRDEHAAP